MVKDMSTKNKKTTTKTTTTKKKKTGEPTEAVNVADHYKMLVRKHLSNHDHSLKARCLENTEK